MALLFLGTIATKLLGLLSDVQGVRSMVVGTVTIPADFALLMLRYFALAIGSALVAPAIASAGQKKWEAFRKRSEYRAKARKILPHLDHASFEEMKAMLRGAHRTNGRHLNDVVAFGIVEHVLLTRAGINLFQLRPGVKKEVRREIRRRAEDKP